MTTWTRRAALTIAGLTIAATALIPATATADTSNAQLAAQITAACDAHPGACRHTPTAATVASVFVPWICAWTAQDTSPTYDRPGWSETWPQIQAATLDAGRCADPSDTELAAEVNALPGGGSYRLHAGEVASVLGFACRGVGTPMPTAYARAAVAVIADSGRC